MIYANLSLLIYLTMDPGDQWPGIKDLHKGIDVRVVGV